MEQWLPDEVAVDRRGMNRPDWGAPIAETRGWDATVELTANQNGSVVPKRKEGHVFRIDTPDDLVTTSTAYSTTVITTVPLAVVADLRSLHPA